MAPPPRVIGIDFSGARNAGKLIWIADGVRDGAAFRLSSCAPACELGGSGVVCERALAALVNHIGSAGDAAVGIDVPFGLPEALFDAQSWRAFLDAFIRFWPDPDSFRAGCCRASPGRELRRDTDREAKTPFSPYNLKLFRQTWRGIAGMLAPLVLTGRAVAVPMQHRVPGRPVLMECCPASFLKLRTEGLYRPYKGRDAMHRAQRHAILRWLVAHGALAPLAAPLERRILDNAGGDALDAVIAATIALRESADAANLRPRPGWERRDALEARVYF